MRPDGVILGRHIGPGLTVDHDTRKVAVSVGRGLWVDRYGVIHAGTRPQRWRPIAYADGVTFFACAITTITCGYLLGLKAGEWGWGPAPWLLLILLAGNVAGWLARSTWGHYH